MSEQPKPTGEGTPIFPLVIEDLKERERRGIETYGQSLRAKNGRDVLQDLYEELLDAALYVKQAMVERDAPPPADAPHTAPCGADPITGLPAAKALYDMWRVCSTPGPKFSEGLLRPGRVIGVNGYKESILEEAQRLVHGDRGASYGHPIFDMTRTADMVTALLRDKLRVGTRLEAEDVGQMMVAVKMSRHRHSPKRDNLTDTAGYAETLSMIKAWREDNPGVDPRDKY